MAGASCRVDRGRLDGDAEPPDRGPPGPRGPGPLRPARSVGPERAQPLTPRRFVDPRQYRLQVPPHTVGGKLGVALGDCLGDRFVTAERQLLTLVIRVD